MAPGRRGLDSVHGLGRSSRSRGRSLRFPLPLPPPPPAPPPPRDAGGESSRTGGEGLRSRGGLPRPFVPSPALLRSTRGGDRSPSPHSPNPRPPVTEACPSESSESVRDRRWAGSKPTGEDGGARWPGTATFAASCADACLSAMTRAFAAARSSCAIRCGRIARAYFWMVIAAWLRCLRYRSAPATRTRDAAMSQVRGG